MRLRTKIYAVAGSMSDTNMADVAQALDAPEAAVLHALKPSGNPRPRRDIPRQRGDVHGSKFVRSMTRTG